MIENVIHSIRKSLHDFDPSSKVWVYFGDRKLTEVESNEVNKSVLEFCAQWTSHGSDVKASGFIILDQIIVLVADIAKSSVSGCSTDSSVRFIQELGSRYKLDFMSRDLHYLVQNKIKSCDLSTVASHINPETIVFNPFFANLSDFYASFAVEASQSKYKRFLN
jgi:hypothetical protein